MTRKQKLYQRLLNHQKNVNFNDFVTIIEAFGFVRSRISGSHWVFDHPALPQSISIQPDKNNQAKPYQVRKFLRLVEKYRLRLEKSAPDDEESDE